MIFPDVVLEQIAKRLSPGAWILLDILYRKEGMCLQELRNILNLKQNQPKLYAELYQCYGACLVDFKQDAADSRKTLVSINDNGITVLENYRNLS